MKLTREHIVVLVVFVLVLVSLGTAYQFYYIPRVQEYKEHIKQRDQLKDAVTRVEGKFNGTQPTVIIQAVNDQIQPLQEELIQRAKFFNISDLNEIEAVPENKILRFYYIDEYNKMINKLRQDAYTKNIYLPEVLAFGAPRPEDLAGRTMELSEVRQGLKRVAFGCSMVRMLIDAKVQYIDQCVIWPTRLSPAYDKLLYGMTTGLKFYMPYSDLVGFLEKLRTSDRYFSVNALSLQNRYLRWPTDPPLEVSLLITQAVFNPPAPEAAPGGAGGTAKAGPRLSAEERLMDANMLKPRGGRMAREELTRGQKILRWLRKYVIPF
jgi:hypothetical protein